MKSIDTVGFPRITLCMAILLFGLLPIWADDGPERLGVVTISVTSRGFEPSGVTIPATRVQLTVLNRTRSSLQLRLDAGHGPSLKELHMAKESAKWRSLLSLTPGPYTLTERDHPSWSCRIQVQPN